MKFDSYLFSHIGGRSENQDALGRVENDRVGLYAVADGLGGHQDGRLASDQVITMLLGGVNNSEHIDQTGLYTLVKQANDSILKLQQERKCVTKSTVVALAIQDEKAVWANTGDSRLYYLHNGSIFPVTADHSVSYMKYKAGEITKEEIAQDEDQSSLLRALGGATRWEPDTGEIEGMQAGDGFLLCSDGAWEYLTDEEILVDYLKSESAKQWACLLLLRIIARVPYDNDNLSLISVLLGK